MKILNRFNSEVIFEFNTKSIKLCLEAAVKGGANLVCAIIEGATLEGATLVYANLESADLESATLVYVALEGADLEGATLEGATFVYAILEGATLVYADLESATLEGADLEGVKGIIAVQFEGFSRYIQKDKSKISCMWKTNDEWLSIAIEDAIKMGIKKHHYEIYKAFLEAGIAILKICETNQA